MNRNRVLIVDDDPQIRSIVVRLLKLDGIEALSAASTREAERVLENGPIDLLLCDHHMPGENGLPFLHRVKKQYPNITRILVTGSRDLDLGVQAINTAQVEHILTKPFEAAELRALALRLLDRPAKAAVEPRRSHTKQRKKELNHLDSDHPGIADIRRDTQGAIVLDHDLDDLDDLSKTFDNWTEFAESQEIKSHEELLGTSDDFAKLFGT